MSILADITPLRISPAFRRLWWGQGLANIGTNLTTVAVGMEVYAITGSSFSVGMLGLAALFPVIVLGLYGGALADQYDRRKVALVASLVMWLATLGIVAQAFWDLRNVWVLYALVGIQAGAMSVNSPARSAIIPRLVGIKLLPAANALNMMTMTVGMMAGPVIGAVLVGLIGYGPTYLIDAITFTFVLYAVYRLPPIVPERSDDAEEPVRGWKSVAQGLHFLATRKNVSMTFWLDMCAMFTSFPRTVFPAVAALSIGGDGTVGLLSAFLAAGTLLASVFSGSLLRVWHHGRAVVVAIIGWAIGIIGFGGVLLLVGETRPGQPILWALLAAGVALAFAGAADSVSSIFRNTILQSATPDDLRGRLQGVFIVVVTGGPRMGDLIAGADANWLGESWAMVVGGCACILGVVVLTLWNRGFLAYDAQHPVA